MVENNYQTSKIQHIILLIILFLPLIFNPYGESVFIVSKMTFLKILTITLFFTIVVRFGSNNILIIPKTNLIIPIFIFLITKVISTVFSIHRYTSIEELENVLFCLLFYFLLIIILKDEKMLNYSIYVCLITATCVSIYAILQVCGIDFVVWSDAAVSIRPSSTLGNPNFLASYLSIILPMFFYSLFISQKFISKFLISISVIIIFNAFLYTYTRGGWLSSAISLFIFFLLTIKSIKKNLFFLIFIILSISISAYFINKKTITIEGQKFNLIDRATRTSPSVRVRLHLWKDSLYLSRDGFPSGFGLETFSLAYPKRRSVEILRIQSPTALPENAHNEFLQIFVTEGLLGIFSHFFILLVIFLTITKNIMRDRNNLLAVFLLSSFIAYLMQSLVNPKIVDVKFLFWMFAGFFFYINPNYEFLKLKISRSPKRAKIISILFVFSIMFLIIPHLFKPYIADYLFRKGRDSIGDGKYEEAITLFYRAMEINPLSTLYIRNSAMFIRKVTEASGDKKFIEQSIGLYDIAKKLNPMDASIYSDTARAWSIFALVFNEKKYYENAISEYKKAIQIDPKFSIFHNDLGIAYMHKGDYKLAEKYFRNAIEITPEFYEPYFNMGILYYRQKKLKYAISYTKKAIVFEPGNYESWGNLIFYYREANDIENAILWTKKARKQFPFDKNFKRLLQELKDERFKNKL